MEHSGYTLTPELSLEAFERDKAELLDAFNPRYVQITQQKAPDGCLGLFQITVLARSYIVTSQEDASPKEVDKSVFYIKVYEGYPAIAPQVYFAPNRRLAHVNTHRNGVQCIDKWGRYSSLVTVAEKTIRACIYDENVTKYESKACATLETWQKGMAAKKAFPTIDPPDLILKSNAGREPAPQLPPPLPRKFPTVEPRRSPLPPPLPNRR